MQGVREYIIKIEQAFKDEIKLKSGLELKVVSKLDQPKYSNRIGEVISTPARGDNHIEKGSKVLIDPTVLFKQIYRGQYQESMFLVDKEKGYYRVEPNMVIMYQKDNTWYCNNHNVLIEPIYTEVDFNSGIYLNPIKKLKKNYGKIAYINKKLLEEGLKVGDEVIHVSNREFEFEFEGNIYFQMRDVDVLAKVI